MLLHFERRRLPPHRLKRRAARKRFTDLPTRQGALNAEGNPKKRSGSTSRPFAFAPNGPTVGATWAFCSPPAKITNAPRQLSKIFFKSSRKAVPAGHSWAF